MTRRELSWALRTLLVGSLAILSFEAVALFDWKGAKADDMDLISTGTAGASGYPPPNIMFLLDTSGSMADLICEDLDADLQCNSDNLLPISGPNGSTICKSPALAAAQGLDVDNNGTNDLYLPLYAADGATYQRTASSIYDPDTATKGELYPIFDPRDPTKTSDDRYTPWTIMYHDFGGTNPYAALRTSSNTGSNQNKMDDIINTQCSTLSNVHQKNRCIYAFRTLGYYWEDPSCASGDPYGTGGGTGTCIKPVPRGLGAACQRRKDCDSGNCRKNACSACKNNSDCSGSATCINTGCQYSYCSNTTCTMPVCTGTGCATSNGTTANGGSCSSNADCASGHCSPAHGSHAAQCDVCWSNSDCNSGLTCLYQVCTDTSCNGLTRDPPWFLGDFLNFYPPKGPSMVRVVGKAAANLPGDARVGLSDFGDSSGNVQFPEYPSCATAQSSQCTDGVVGGSSTCFSPTDTLNTDASGYTFQKYLWSQSFSGGTPLAIKLDNVGRYFAGSTTGWCSYTGLCGDAKSFVVIVTDGEPTGDATSTSSLPYTGKISGMKDGYAYANGFWVDDVAKGLTVLDERADITGVQNLSTYVISYGFFDATDPSNCVGLLKDTANAGAGTCITALNSSELAVGLANVMTTISHRARGFVASGVSGTRTTSTVSVESTMFRPTSTFPFWEGHVFGFQLCDQRLGSCTCAGSTDPNAVCIQDANKNAVTFSSDGYLTGRPFWDAALCLAGDADGSEGSLPPDFANIDSTKCYVAPDKRVIKTATAGYASSTSVLDGGDQFDFTAANVAASPAFQSALGASSVADGQLIVNFVRGYDVNDANLNGSKTDFRNLNTFTDNNNVVHDGWWVLGDIFHSTPAILGTTYCPQTTNPQPIPDLGDWTGTASFQAFWATIKDRPEVMLVGANDGMLHAFKVGAWDSSACRYIEDSSEPTRTLGTELWGFVSPEMLPKLQSLCTPNSGVCSFGSHKYMVDGSVMVRNVWTGGTAKVSDAANASKWKTVAVYGHRMGGLTYVALDITDVTSPKFLWQFPPAGTTLSEPMGNSWLDIKPAPASIGPIAIADGSTRWVALLPGGLDLNDAKGRALYMVDAYTGEQLWSVAYTGSNGMKYSFAAEPVFQATDGGSSLPTIKFIVAADHGGQLWRIDVPMQKSQAGPYTLGTPYVFFQAGPSGTAPIAPGSYQRWPFFYSPMLSRNTQTGDYVLTIGTGDREQLIPHAPAGPVGGNSGYVCQDRQRLYSMKIGLCGTHVCRETAASSTSPEIAEVTATSTAPTNAVGWFYQLGLGEKVTNISPNRLGYAFYPTFLPTAGCGVSTGSGTATCNADSKGNGYVYIFKMSTGAQAAVVDQGSGVPAAPVLSVGQGATGASIALVGGGSDSGPAAVSVTSSLGGSVIQQAKFLTIPISVELHNTVHPN